MVKSTLSTINRNRWVCVIALVVVIFMGLGSRRFGNVLPQFIVEHAGDSLWTVAVYLCFCIAFPNWSPPKILLAALAVSLAVEISQLLNWPVLETIRNTKIGKLVLGTGFLWIDWIRYVVGAISAYFVDNAFFYCPANSKSCKSDQ